MFSDRGTISDEESREFARLWDFLANVNRAKLFVINANHSFSMTCRCMAERQGFEPWIPCGIHAFQACAFSHSAISPTPAQLYESTTRRPEDLG